VKLPFDNSHGSDELDTRIECNCPAIINDVMKLQLGPLPRKEFRWLVNDMDVSEKWHLFKEELLKLAKRDNLFVEVTSSRYSPKIKEITRDAVSELQILAVCRSYGERDILKVIRNI
ncbi:773_t:CDS:2, partial [Acaulospora morrowiae]